MANIEKVAKSPFKEVKDWECFLCGHSAYEEVVVDLATAYASGGQYTSGGLITEKYRLAYRCTNCSVHFGDPETFNKKTMGRPHNPVIGKS